MAQKQHISNEETKLSREEAFSGWLTERWTSRTGFPAYYYFCNRDNIGSLTLNELVT